MPRFLNLKYNKIMNNKEIEKLLTDCANFIEPYNDGGNKAEDLMIRLDEALTKFKKFGIGDVSVEFPVYHIDCGGICMVGIEIENNTPKVVGAMDGGGNAINADEIIVSKGN